MKTEALGVTVALKAEGKHRNFGSSTIVSVQMQLYGIRGGRSGHIQLSWQMSGYQGTNGKIGDHGSEMLSRICRFDANFRDYPTTGESHR